MKMYHGRVTPYFQAAGGGTWSSQRGGGEQNQNQWNNKNKNKKSKWLLLQSGGGGSGGNKMTVREAEASSNLYLSLNNPEWRVEIKNVTVRVTHGAEIMSTSVSVLSSTGSHISMWQQHDPILLLEGCT